MKTKLPKFIGASLLLACLGMSPAQAQGPWVTTTCGYRVATTVTYNSPLPGQSTFTWTVQNTNPGNGKNNGTYKDLSHLDQVYNSCVDPTKRISGGGYGKDPSQNCLTGSVLKFDYGTSGSTPTTYTAVFNSVSYVPVLVNASFKAGNGCCSGQIYGIGCCVVTGGTINGAQTVCNGGDPGVLGNVTSGTANGILSYQWQSNTTGCGGAFADITGANGATFDPPSGITQTTWYRRVTTSSFSGGGPSCSDNSNCIQVTVLGSPKSLLGTNVTGTLNFGGGSTNYFNSSNGFVPAGCNNSGLGSATVTISNPSNEFCFADGANTDNANFTANTLTITDVSVGGGTFYTMTFALAPGLVTSVTETSDNFLNGGVSYSLVGDLLTLSVPAFGSGGSFAASYTFTTSCNPVGFRMIAGNEEGNVSQASSSIGGLTQPKAGSPSLTSGQLRVYPNPNTGSFNLYLPYFENQAEITVSNVQGQVIMRKVVNAVNGNTVKLDLENVSRGMYLIDASFNGEHVRTKMTVQ